MAGGKNFKAFGLKNFSYERGAFCQKKYSGKSDAFIIYYIYIYELKRGKKSILQENFGNELSN